MIKWPPILTTTAGFVIVFLVAGSLLISPCGPGSEWPAFTVTLIYSIAIFAVRFKIRAYRFIALVLAIFSLGMLAHSLHARHEYGIKLRARVLELQAQSDADGKGKK